MEEHKNNKHQENLFYEKLTEFEKDYIESIYNINSNYNDNIQQQNNNNNFLSNKLKEIQDLISEMIKLQKSESVLNYMSNGDINDENFREIKLKDLFKKIKKISKEEGGFLFMPFRMIFYNFCLKYKSGRKAQKEKAFTQASILLETSIVVISIVKNFRF